MAQARCRNGHIYDTEVYMECPYCDSNARTIDFAGNRDVKQILQDDIKKTAPISRITPGSRNYPGSEEVTPSTPASRIFPDPEVVAPTAPVGLGKPETIRHTMPVFTQKYVVGWLVCVQGKEVGMDHRLEAKTNTIGRGSDMDVKIKGDDTISSDTHAKIDYDILNNDFYLIPGNNKNTIYLNKSPVYVPQKLKAYNRIRLGKTELIFIPFCCDQFVWPEAGKNDDL